MSNHYPAYNTPPQWSNTTSYPPYNNTKPSIPAGHWTTNVNLEFHQTPQSNGPQDRNIARTPSPTPSELKELKSGAINWREMISWRFWIRREWLWYYVALFIILVITALVAIYHDQIVKFLTPVTVELQKLSWGWVIPILVLFVISFPPLFGHEIVAILCGLVWGLWIGFGIVAAGTFIGEVGNFYAFKYCCRARGEKYERTKISYACLAKVVRDGGFKIALIARLSAIPGHFTTAVFSTCGMGIVVFSLAAILSLPKQFITVYLGVILKQSGEGKRDTKSRIISDVVLAVTFLVTVVACWYILRQMDKVKPEVIYQRRKARQAKLNRASLYGNGNMSNSQVFNGSETHIPLTAHNNGEKLSSAQASGSGNIRAPQPHRVAYPGMNDYGYSKSEDDLESAESGSSNHHGEGYGISKQSVDDVSWDTGRYGEPQRPTFYPPGIDPSQGQQPTFTSHQTPTHFTSSQSLHTPTQAQFNYTSHVAEPTDMTYRTAREPSEMTEMGGEPTHAYGGRYGRGQEFDDGGRVLSPPPRYT